MLVRVRCAKVLCNPKAKRKCFMKLTGRGESRGGTSGKSKDDGVDKLHFVYCILVMELDLTDIVRPLGLEFVQ